jgi:hypothetical protein
MISYGALIQPAGTRNSYKISGRKPQGKWSLGNAGVVGKIILKFIL